MCCNINYIMEPSTIGVLQDAPQIVRLLKQDKKLYLDLRVTSGVGRMDSLDKYQQRAVERYIVKHEEGSSKDKYQIQLIKEQDTEGGSHYIHIIVLLTTSTGMINQVVMLLDATMYTNKHDLLVGMADMGNVRLLQRGRLKSRDTNFLIEFQRWQKQPENSSTAFAVSSKGALFYMYKQEMIPVIGVLPPTRDSPMTIHTFDIKSYLVPTKEQYANQYTWWGAKTVLGQLDWPFGENKIYSDINSFVLNLIRKQFPEELSRQDFNKPTLFVHGGGLNINESGFTLPPWLWTEVPTHSYRPLTWGGMSAVGKHNLNHPKNASVTLAPPVLGYISVWRMYNNEFYTKAGGRVLQHDGLFAQVPSDDPEWSPSSTSVIHSRNNYKPFEHAKSDCHIISKAVMKAADIRPEFTVNINNPISKWITDAIIPNVQQVVATTSPKPSPKTTKLSKNKKTIKPPTTSTEKKVVVSAVSYNLSFAVARHQEMGSEAQFIREKCTKDKMCRTAAVKSLMYMTDKASLFGFQEYVPWYDKVAKRRDLKFDRGAHVEKVSTAFLIGPGTKIKNLFASGSVPEALMGVVQYNFFESVLTCWDSNIFGKATQSTCFNLTNSETDIRPCHVIKTASGIVLVNMHMPHNFTPVALQSKIESQASFAHGARAVILLGDFNDVRGLWLGSGSIDIFGLKVKKPADSVLSCCYDTNYAFTGDYVLSSFETTAIKRVLPNGQTVTTQPTRDQIGRSDHEPVQTDIAVII